MLHGRLTILTSALAGAAMPVLAAPLYTVTPLQTLGAASGATAYAINSSGAAVGNAFLPSPGISHAAVWNGGIPTDLGTLGGTTSVAFGISDKGTVVGQSFTAAGATQAFASTGGVMTGLGTLGGKNSAAYGVNDAGQIVGDSLTTTGFAHGFLYSGGVMTDLGTLGGLSSRATAINSAGTITGHASNGSADQAFIHSKGMMTGLGTLGGPSSAGLAINDNGVVVGYSHTAANVLHAFRWTAGVMEDLGTLGGTRSEANAINLHGDIVGLSTATTGKGAPLYAFLYTESSMFNLNTLLAGSDPDAAGLELRNARGINDNGLIVADGCYTASGSCGAFLLTPIVVEVAATPEPAGMAVLATGLAGLWAGRRRGGSRAGMLGTA